MRPQKLSVNGPRLIPALAPQPLPMPMGAVVRGDGDAIAGARAAGAARRAGPFSGPRRRYGTPEQIEEGR
jgi:hypothetical protein